METEKIVRVNQVEPNMTLLVRPGERIPLDGNVADGFSHVDQAVVTGESVPVTKKVERLRLCRHIKHEWSSKDNCHKKSQ